MPNSARCSRADGRAERRGSMQTMKIGQVAERSGVSRDTIRYYEKLGLLPRPARTPSGYRIYSAQACQQIQLIRNALRFGFSLKEITAFVCAREQGIPPCHKVRAIGARILETVDRRIADL